MFQTDNECEIWYYYLLSQSNNSTSRGSTNRRLLVWLPTIPSFWQLLWILISDHTIFTRLNELASDEFRPFAQEIVDLILIMSFVNLPGRWIVIRSTAINVSNLAHLMNGGMSSNKKFTHRFGSFLTVFRHQIQSNLFWEVIKQLWRLSNALVSHSHRRNGFINDRIQSHGHTRITVIGRHWKDPNVRRSQVRWKSRHSWTIVLSAQILPCMSGMAFLFVQVKVSLWWSVVMAWFHNGKTIWEERADIDEGNNRTKRIRSFGPR
jgi:hypothetical protein